jgi:hypothetical protein
MVPPHDSDAALLPSAESGDESAIPAANDAPGGFDSGARWQVLGPLPNATVPLQSLAAAVWPTGSHEQAFAASGSPIAAGPPAYDAAASYPAVQYPAAQYPAPPMAIPLTAPGQAPAPAPSAQVDNSAIDRATNATASEPAAAALEMANAGNSSIGDVPSWLASVVVHLVVLIALASINQWWNRNPPKFETSLVLEERPLDSLIESDAPQVEEVDLTALDAAETEIIESAEKGDVLEGIGLEDDPLASHIDALAPPNDPTALVAASAEQIFKSAVGGDLSGRGALSKAELLTIGGGTPQSEEAVARALRWLVAHQSDDGGWNFDHTHGTSCGKRCSGVGSTRNARNGATAMALLPLLGAGNTHHSGKYKESVDRGLRFLMLRQDKKTGSFHEPQGDMYSHGLAAIALCEAYAMTKDRKLHEPAQGAIDFIATAQDPVGGGWRYAPRQPGDTSVVGWQMMALKSGLMGYLDVPPDTVKLAGRFLDHVQDGDGSQYGYTDSGGEPATTSIGLLCRMYMGWRRDHPPLMRGIEYLRTTGPSPSNMYYNYYATQVVHHYGGEAWRDWNAKMRDSLVKGQVKTGHSAGSWLMNDRFVGQGGRLYCTALAAMILEVYYRHLPIYREESVRTRVPATK